MRNRVLIQIPSQRLGRLQCKPALTVADIHPIHKLLYPTHVFHTTMSVLSVSLSTTHRISNTPQASIPLIANLGVDGDCHNGQTVEHRSRLHITPAPPNLHQVHLIQAELFTDLCVPDQRGGTSYTVNPGQLGENINIAGINLLALSTGTKLHFLAAGQGDGHGRTCYRHGDGTTEPLPTDRWVSKGTERELPRERWDECGRCEEGWYHGRRRCWRSR